MPVDKLCRNCDRTTTVYTGINIANLMNNFQRSDGGNTAIEAIDMNGNIIKNDGSVVKSRCCNQELCRHKRFYYCWRCVSVDIKLNVGSDLAKSI